MTFLPEPPIFLLKGTRVQGHTPPPSRGKASRAAGDAGWGVIFKPPQAAEALGEETPGRGRRPDAKWGVTREMQSYDKDGGVIFNLSQSYQAECFPSEQSWSQTNVSPSTPAPVV